jgi:hypothetical protein
MANKPKYYVISHRSLEHLCEELNSIKEEFDIVAYTQEFGVTKLLLQKKEY